MSSRAPMRIRGKAKSEDSSAAKQFQQQTAQMPAAAAATPPTSEGAKAGEAVDESGVEAKDIESVISQAGCTRPATVRGSTR
eukprot:scaffold3666_cov160-Amphora_coffeaeformis.AAC.17